VRPESALDREAFRRGTSVYVPGTVEPMLPRALSDDACSLAPGVDRLAVTAEIVLDAGGAPRSASFKRSVIRSDSRLDYDQLDRIFAGRDAPPAEITAPLELARRAAAALAAKRRIAALDVESFEPEFEFDSTGHVTGASSVEQTEAHRLIEHLMILTNEQVAEVCERRRVPTLYRVHEQPDPQRVEALFEQLAALDVPTPPLPGNLAPRRAGELVAEASRLVAAEAKRRGHGRGAYTSLVLRALKQAYYNDRNLGHAGLGSPAYSHFTSPIRRYPDLIAHRALLSMIGAGEGEPVRVAAREAGPWCSEREREAMGIEREADRICAAFLLERELFEGGWERAFAGEVSGVIGAGAFVRFAGDLGDVYEGLVPARRLRGERFDLDETGTALVGGRTGRTLRLGDPLEVKVESVDAPRGRVDLLPAQAEGAA
jgi:ribonuclease R